MECKFYTSPITSVFNALGLKSLTLQAIGITVGQQPGWSEAASRLLHSWIGEFQDFTTLNPRHWYLSPRELAHATFHMLQICSTPVAAIGRHPVQSRSCAGRISIGMKRGSSPTVRIERSHRRAGLSGATAG
jgi:hypothetical protein